jgi:HNH endonuclease
MYERWDRHQPLNPRDSSFLRELLLDFLGNQCNECGSWQNLEIDHILPLWKGGANVAANVWILCKTCHLAKTKRERNWYGSGKDDARRKQCNPCNLEYPSVEVFNQHLASAAHRNRLSDLGYTIAVMRGLRI